MTQMTNDQLRPVSILGDESLGGTYLLRLRVECEVAVQFGRFRQAHPGGQAVVVPAGECLYVGSAMRGLGARLLRHASRTDPSNPQPIRAEMAALFVSAGLVKERRLDVASTGSASVTWPFPPKRLHWHIDYLLEKPEVELTHVIVLRSRVRLERLVAFWLLREPPTFAFAPGLGASDNPVSTHLLGIGVDEADEWWPTFPQRLLLLEESARQLNLFDEQAKSKLYN